MPHRTSLFLFASLFVVGCGAAGAEDDGALSTAELTCTPFTNGMVVTRTTKLCGSAVRRVAVAAGDAAITIDGDDVTLTCDEGSVIENTSGFGANSAPPSVGIRIGARRNVTVKGCAARGFRYGLVAKGTRDLKIEGAHFDHNFTDESQEWVQDGVQGGGVRLEDVERGLVVDSTFGRNWNGIELRRTKNVKVSRSKGDHCSNWGAFVDHSDDSELSDNDFDWGIRWGRRRPVTEIPIEQWNRQNWFGQDTKDSGGIIVDGGSARTRILRNSVRYGGDGIFVRAITGRCPTDTWVEGNDVSYSPHFALETWCDGDTYIDNFSEHSDNGFWLGGGSNIAVIGNRIENSRVYAMSIMENQGRHILVQDNVFAKNRAGIMVSGRNRWPGQSMDSSGWPHMANSSHIVIQRNTFTENELADVAASFTRSLVVASNCSDGQDTEVALGPETEAVETIGHCGSAAGSAPPSVEVAAVGTVALGRAVSLSATGSAPNLSYTWLVQPANHRFPSGQLPPALFSKVGGGPTAKVTFSKPGLYDVDVTVDDGKVAGLFATASLDDPRARPGWKQVAVPPVGRRIGERAAEWTFSCGGAECETDVTEEQGLDGAAVRLKSNAPKKLAAIVPASRQLGMAIDGATKIGFFLRAKNPKVWQRSFPKVVVGGDGGQLTFENQVLDQQRQAAGNVLKFGETDWVYVEIPLAGGDGFTRSVQGAAPATIDWIEIHSETTPGDPLELTVDDLTLY